MRRLAVVGGGWAGLAAAVRAAERGHEVVLLEMARTLGGRARTVDHPSGRVDNGQHILIGAYVRTLALMRDVGVDPSAVLARLPLSLVTPDGSGLRLRSGLPPVSFVGGVMRHTAWRLADRLRLIGQAAVWASHGFRCDPRATVAEFCRALPSAVQRDLVDPLCVAALNTPASDASALVFLRVLRDALFSGRGGSDLLIPRRRLGELLPEAAARSLSRAGAKLRLGTRVQRLESAPGGWQVDGETFDAIVVACTAREAARLLEPQFPRWASQARALNYEPIVTVTLECPGARFADPMVLLPAGPAQFAFDHGALGGHVGRFTFVISGARSWLDAGTQATQDAVLEQAKQDFDSATWPQPPVVVALMRERRATFRCSPALDRPPGHVAPRLAVAGDYVEGPYPATLEGAVRSGEAAAAMALDW